MKVLLVHNRYQHPGGEDVVFAAEVELLTRAGHRVIQYVRWNEEIATRGWLGRARLAASTLWARDSYHAVRDLVRRECPDVAHFHNTFPLVSPAAYYACREGGVPVVQTLHNYRLLCPAATFLRNGRPCELCLGRGVPWPGVLHRCYRRSRAASAVVAAMLVYHRSRRTWSDQVNCYIALTEFSRQKFVQGGLPADRTIAKPNFVYPDPGPRRTEGRYALFVGRLSAEKGLTTLLEAWKRVPVPVPLVLAGDGPERARLEAAASDVGSVRFLGRLSREAVIAAMHQASFLVFPAECYENFPLAIAEAFACGVPVIATRLGAMAEIVADGRTGLHFAAGDPDDLAAKVVWALSHPHEMEAMGRAARAEYEAKYTSERNYEMLMEIYERAARQRSDLWPRR